MEKNKYFLLLNKQGVDNKPLVDNKPVVVNKPVVKPLVDNKQVFNKLNLSKNYNLSYYICKNFGDAVGHILYNFLSVTKLNHVEINPNKISFLTVGSILNLATNKHIIMGSGFIKLDDELKHKPYLILSVRGPKTRDKLLKMNIDCPEKYGDPLIVFPLLYNEKQSIKYTIGIIPHYIDKDSDKLKELLNILKNKNYKINIIDIVTGLNYKPFIDEINKCEYIISSSLHGIIMGLVYGKKTIFTQFSNKVIGDLFKFEDFFLSLNIDYNVKKYDDIDLLENIIKVNKTRLNNIGIDIINVCPFIKNERKSKLINLWKEHILTHFI